MQPIKSMFQVLTLSAAAMIAANTHAHVSVAAKLYSNSYSVVELAIPHGCEGFDTVKVEVSLPSTLTGVRPLEAVFGPSTLETTEDGTVTKITWVAQKAEVYPSDSHAYTVAFRAKTPDDDFAILHFPTVQTCKDTDGNAYTSAWVGMSAGHDHNAESDELPAPSAVLYPKVAPGWHQFTATDHMHDMSLFSDAEIVWKGSAAYSANPHTMQMIVDDVEVSVLSEIHPTETFWVKY